MADRIIESTKIESAAGMSYPNLLDPGMYSRPAAENMLRGPVASNNSSEVINFADHGDIYKMTGDSTKKFAVEVEEGSKVSRAYRESVDRWLDSLPDSIKQKMVANHVKIVLVSEMKDAIGESSANQQARGHRPGETVAMQPGIYSPSLKKIVMAENRELTPIEKMTEDLQKRTTSYFGNRGFDKAIAWHELGHALDSLAENHMSQTDGAFRDAYAKDAQAIAKLYPGEYPYYLKNTQQTEPAAREEALAELFMRAHKPAATQTDGDRRMLHLFANTVSAMRAHKLVD